MKNSIFLVPQNNFVIPSSVQSLSFVPLFATLWTVVRQASLSITNSQCLLKLMSIESVMPSNHLILCRPLLFPPSTFPSIRIFSNEGAQGPLILCHTPELTCSQTDTQYAPRDFPGCPVVKTLHFHSREHRLHLWLWN